ncbi:MAG: hypothetical protein U0T75_06520 [Chitinophagales bacterium]
MKKLFRTFCAVALIGAIATTSSCTKTCDAGYEGTKCDVEIRGKYISNYSVTETCQLSGAVGPYTAEITKSSTDILKIFLNNFGDFSSVISITATVDGNNITIPAQTVSGYTINGSGSLSGNVLSISYTVSAGGTSETCTATWTKQ